MAPRPLEQPSLDQRRGFVGPRVKKGHRCRIVDTSRGEAREIREIIIGGEANLNECAAESQIK
jgi:hypothetical protein